MSLEAAESATNTPVGAESTIEVRGSSPSFEDLEAISTPKPNGDSFGKEKKEPLEKKEAREDNGKQQKLSKEETTDKAAKELGDKPDSEVSLKYIKAKHNDQEIELATDTAIPTKVAGKLESPTLAELQANYSGKVNWDRKYSELSTERSAFQENVTQLNGLINSMIEASKDDPFKFYDVVADAIGRDPVEMKLEAYDQQLAMVEKLMQMAPDDRKNWRKNLAMQFKEDSLNARESRVKQADQAKADFQEISQLKDKYRLTDESYTEAEKVAKEMIKGREVTREDIVLVDRHMMTLKAIEQVNPDLADRGDFHDIVSKFRDEAVQNPGYTEADLKEMVEGVFGDQRTKRLAKKIKDSDSLGQGQVKTFKNEKEVLFSFDQL